MKHHWICAGMLTWLVFCPGTSLAADAPRGISARLADLLSELPRDAGGTGILYDRVLSLADPERHNGTAAEQPATPGEWRQLYDEFRRAASPGPGEAWPSLAEIRARGEADAARGVVRLAVINLRYSRIREDALDSGALVVRGNRLVLGDRPAPNASGPFVTKRIVAMTPLHPCTYRGGQIAFRLDARDFFSNAGTLPAKVEIDFDDGRGFVSVALGDEHIASYATTRCTSPPRSPTRVATRRGTPTCTSRPATRRSSSRSSSSKASTTTTR
jgi:hypothetical protein